MTQLYRFQQYQRPQMVDEGEIEEIWINPDAVQCVVPLRPIEGRKPQAIVHFSNANGQTQSHAIVIGSARDVAMTMTGYFDE